MIVSLVQILSSHGQAVVKDIRANLASTGTNATGKTSQSIQYEVTEEGTHTILFVYGRPFVFTVETGRGPRKSSQSQNVKQRILEWMEAKGVGVGLDQVKKEALAKFLTWRINKEGTELHKKDGRKDVISNVVNESLYDEITADVLSRFSKAYLDNIKIAIG
jgi:hypothetical protein